MCLNELNITEKQPKQTELGQRLRQIRAEIVASGKPWLNREIEQEVINGRGGLQNQI